MSQIGPSMMARVDQSYTGALQVRNQNLTQEVVQKLSSTCWGIVNLWRPLTRRVPRAPIAVSDARSVDDAHLIDTHIELGSPFSGVSEGKGFNVWRIRYRPNHKWWYQSGMGTDEALLIKCFDSKLGGRARRCPHSGVLIEGQDEEAEARESVEVRCLVFWEDRSVE